MAVESLFGQGRSDGEEIGVEPCEMGKKPSSSSPTAAKAVESAGLVL